MLSVSIFQIRTLHNIKAVEFNGKILHLKCKKVLNKFQRSISKAGVHMLILSTLGTISLNLACANIMIIIVHRFLIFHHHTNILPCNTLWSALDNKQLRGHIYRFLQWKIIRFYRLVAHSTSDVFLNNFTFDKRMLHHAFIGIIDKACIYSFFYIIYILTDVLVMLFNSNDSKITMATTMMKIDSDDDVIQNDKDVKMIETPQRYNRQGNENTSIPSPSWIKVISSNISNITTICTLKREKVSSLQPATIFQGPFFCVVYSFWIFYN